MWLLAAYKKKYNYWYITIFFSYGSKYYNLDIKLVVGADSPIHAKYRSTRHT